MADNLDGIRKELWNTGGFKMILNEVAGNRPEPLPFNPLSGEKIEVQVEEWKAKSAEQRGFDNAFQFITGHKITDLGENK